MAAVFGDVVVLRAMAEPLIGIDEVKAFPDSLARVLGGEPIRLQATQLERYRHLGPYSDGAQDAT
jgi:hypothetical protein